MVEAMAWTYAYTVLSGLAGALVFLSILVSVPYALFLAVFASWSDMGESRDGDAKIFLQILRWRKMVIGLVVFTVVFVPLVPSRSEWAFIAGAGAAVSISHKSEARKLPENILRAVNGILESLPEKKSTPDSVKGEK